MSEPLYPLKSHNGHGKNGHARPSPVTETPERWNVQVVMAGLPLQATSVLLRRAAEAILVDTGFPQHDEILLDGLRRAGLQAGDITGIINTHFHFDHCGGNYLFPNAWVLASRKDYEWAVTIYDSVCGGEERREVFRGFYPEVTDEEFDRMDEARLLQLIRWMWDPAILGETRRYRWMESSAVAPGGIRIIETPGHTPAHISVLVDGSDGPYLIAGDARAFADEANAVLDMPAYCHADYERTRQRLARFTGIVIPGHDDPFSQTARSTAETQTRPDKAQELSVSAVQRRTDWR